ncbi:glycoside hydrolase superfamily [Cadophora sp. MPI-SDFR-AT-0126]|nr:glycoside hydrolase superfamily [Leotiomycetes sp. MPI-SDFR-AT-0126]
MFHTIISKAAFGLLALGSFVTSAAVDGKLEPRSDRGFPPTLAINFGVFTSKWFEGTPNVQVVELVVSNTHGSNYLTLADNLVISLTSDYVTLVKVDKPYRIAPKESVVVQVGVSNKPGVPQGGSGSATFTLTYGTNYGPAITTSTIVNGMVGFGNYTADANSLNHHWNPDWYHEIKYGIFIHWGIYSVPAFGNTGSNEDYAEWYWKRMNDGPTYKSQTYQYHEATYGRNFNYDDFFPQFTASNFDAKQWMDLIADAGAQYVVPVTKHHDGFALFNISSSISRRTSVNFGPKRDFIKELLDAAKQYQPHIRRGTYFSMPEWYHPGYKKYAIGGSAGHPGGPPHNPYTQQEIPYTGYVPVNDYVVDLQLPEMNQLAYEYETEIMWCDIGGANNATIFASEWLNWARKQGRQVTFNNRCGLPGDFDTPEYFTNDVVVDKKWETNRGMDPFSFGYNFQTPDSTYLTGADIVQTLVDVVSKNGNFLLDIGPKADGTIPQIMQSGLKDAGAWIKAHSESIFNTRYYRITPGLNPFRFTTKLNAFYIHVMSRGGPTVTVPYRIPYLPGDKITVVGGSLAGTEVPVTSWNQDSVTFAVSDAIWQADKYVWTFKALKGYAWTE